MSGEEVVPPCWEGWCFESLLMGVDVDVDVDIELILVLLTSLLFPLGEKKTFFSTSSPTPLFFLPPKTPIQNVLE